MRPETNQEDEMTSQATDQQTEGNSWTYETLCKASDRELEAVLKAGVIPRPEELAGWEFRGYNVNASAEVLRIRKFKKGFYWDPGDSAALLGYNVKVAQNGLLNPWIARLQRGEPIRHALYTIYPVRAWERDNLYSNALMLDYGKGHNPLWDPSRLLRDYLVQVSEQDPDLMLGKAYLATGPARVFGGFFVLERYNKVL